MKQRKPGPPCCVCGEPSAARELCDKHYRRWRRHGHTDNTRPDTWGQNSRHHLWQSWKWTKRVGRAPEWDDFWVFVACIGNRPTENHTLRRRDSKCPFGPENYYWSEPVNDTDFKIGKSEYARKWRKKNPLKARQNDLRKMHGIGLLEYDVLLEKQDGKCAICGEKDEWFNLAVDHCHETGRIRGLLCSQCNRGLGLFRDNPEHLERAAEYLR